MKGSLCIRHEKKPQERSGHSPVLTATFLCCKGLMFFGFILLVKKVYLGEVSGSKLTALLNVTTTILMLALFECKASVLSMMPQVLNTLKRSSVSRSRKRYFHLF